LLAFESVWHSPNLRLPRKHARLHRRDRPVSATSSARA